MNTKYFLLLTLCFSLVFLQSCDREEANFDLEVEQAELENDQINLEFDSTSSSLSSSLTADFIPSIRVLNNQGFVTFINTSILASTFEWSFPGASPESSTLRNPTAVYNQNGTFSVTLVSSRNGVSETITKEVTIAGIQGDGNQTGGDQSANVSARFFASVRIVNNQAQVTINNRSENANSFQWSFPGGTPATSTLENPVITYPRNGTFAITLIASNGNTSDTTTQNLTISNIPGEVVNPPADQVDVRARFFVSVRRVNGQSVVTMRNRSTNATDFQWSFPGGSPETSTEANPTVTYTERGIKTITLVASNGDASATRTVNLTL